MPGVDKHQLGIRMMQELTAKYKTGELETHQLALGLLDVIEILEARILELAK